MKLNDKIQASVEVENTGHVAGSEVVQLYLRDLYSSVVRPVKELKAYQKVYLKPGEKQTVTFEITKKDLMFYNMEMQYVAEPGDFEVMIGNSSKDKDLNKVEFKLL
jgi:beta-glucosidase